MSFENLNENDVLSFMMMANNKCRSCGNERVEVCECNLPEQMKIELKEVGLKGRYLYCSNCNEYSIICNPEFGFL